MSIEAITSVTPVISRLNTAVEATLHEGINAMVEGNFLTALELFDTVIETDPFNVSAYLNKGNVFDLMGNYSDALQSYTSAIDIDPYHAEAWYNKGMTLKKTGAVGEGLECIHRGISLAMGEP